MTRSRTWLRALLAAVAVALPGHAAAQRHPIEICDIQARADRFVGATVRLHAVLIGEWHHGFLLKDVRCDGAIEFALPSESDKGADPLALWNSYMRPYWRPDFPWKDYQPSGNYLDVEIELTGVVRGYMKDVDDWSGSNWAAKTSVGPSRGLRRVLYVDVTSVEAVRFYPLERPRYEIERRRSRSSAVAKPD